MGWTEVMQLPVRAFWLLSNAADRIQADSDLRALRISICAQSNEAQEGLIRELHELRGVVIKKAVKVEFTEQDRQRAREGIETLRQMQFLGG